MNDLVLRAFARCVDLVLVFEGATLLADAFLAPLSVEEDVRLVGVDPRFVGLVAVVGFFVDVVPLPLWGASPGKLLAGLVVSTEGSSAPPLSGFDGFVVSAWRWVLWFGPFLVGAIFGVPWLPLLLGAPAVFTILSPELPRRGLHDYFSGTLVIQRSDGAQTWRGVGRR